MRKKILIWKKLANSRGEILRNHSTLWRNGIDQEIEKLVNTPGWSDFHITQHNDSGMMAGFATKNSGAEQVVLLLPVEVKIMKPDNWGKELPEAQVVLFDEKLRVRVRIPMVFESLAEVLSLPGFDRLTVKTHGTAPNGKEINLNAQNTSFQVVNAQTELRIELPRNALKAAGALPNAEEDGIDEIAWFDLVIDERSNLLDSQAWEAAVVGIPEKDKRGRSYKEGDLETNGDRPIHKSFLVAGGAEVVTVEIAGSPSEKRQLANQADVFYISGHGSYGDGTLLASEDGTERFGAADAEWDKDMEVVIIGGCSVLGIQTKKFRYPSMTGGDRRLYDNHYGHAADPSPGEAWEAIKPDVKLGYAFTAPLDTQGMPDIIAAYQGLVNGGVDPVAAWGQANNGTKGVNGCAIDTRVSPHEYWFFKKVKTGWFSLELQWTKTTKTPTGW